MRQLLPFVPVVTLVLAAACSSKDSGGDKTTPTDAGTDTSTPDAEAPTDAGTEDAEAGPLGPLSPSYVDFSINHVILAGQSNALGNDATTILSSVQIYGNLSFDTGVIPLADCGDEGCTTYQTPTGFAPLVEGDSYYYPVETPASGLANQASKLAKDIYQFGTEPSYPAQHDILVSDIARSGNTYWCMSLAGCNYQSPGLVKPFAQLTMDVTNAKAFATAAGRSYVVRAFANIHGESDDIGYATGHAEFPQAGPADYGAALVQWQTDLEATVKAVTNQTQPVPMFISQLSGWYRTTTSQVAQYQLDAHVAAPGKVILIGPSYPYDINGDDCLHYTSFGSRRIGESFAKVYTKVILGGETWEPVRPKSVTHTDNVVTAQFFVPRPPLVFDTTNVQAIANQGFVFADAGGAVITNVEITAPDTVKITLDKAPTGAMTLSYGQNQPHPAIPADGFTPPDGTCVGPFDRTSSGKSRPAGPRGNVHDSDDTPAESDQTPLVNWMVQFTTAVQ